MNGDNSFADSDHALLKTKDKSDTTVKNTLGMKGKGDRVNEDLGNVEDAPEFFHP